MIHAYLVLAPPFQAQPFNRNVIPTKFSHVGCDCGLFFKHNTSIGHVSKLTFFSV
jgi:hypothetical protein